MRFDLTLYLVSDSTGLSEDEFLRRLEQALRGGVTLLQLREKNRTTLEYYELARKVKKLTDAYGVPLMIDDRVDIALAVDAAMSVQRICQSEKHADSWGRIKL